MQRTFASNRRQKKKLHFKIVINSRFSYPIDGLQSTSATEGESREPFLDVNLVSVSLLFASLFYFFPFVFCLHFYFYFYVHFFVLFFVIFLLFFWLVVRLEIAFGGH